MTPTIYPAEEMSSGRFLGAAYYPTKADVRDALASRVVEADAGGFLRHVASGCMVIVRRPVPADVEQHRRCDDLVAHLSEVQR